MTGLIKPIQRLFSAKSLVPPGIYHYQSPPEDPRNYRYHLRIEETGDGILIVNAATVLHLNQTAAAYAYFVIQNTPPEKVGRRMAAHFQVHPEQARQDYLDLADRLQTLVEVPDLDPVTFLDFDRRQPLSGRISAPLRLDCALTYRLPAPDDEAAAPLERVTRELETAEWTSVLDKAWDAGIPHVIFTGGEPTLRPDLPALVRHAEQLGMVSGVLTDGLRFADHASLASLLLAGLDHLMLILQPESSASWTAVQNSLVEDLAVVVHFTVTSPDAAQSSETLRKLQEIGVTKVSLSAADPSLGQGLAAARDQAAALGLELVWNIPVPYSRLHPVALEHEDSLLDGAGKAWLYVEPDGDVRPSQGDPRLLGNLLSDPWENIWAK